MRRHGAPARVDATRARPGRGRDCGELAAVAVNSAEASAAAFDGLGVDGRLRALGRTMSRRRLPMHAKGEGRRHQGEGTESMELAGHCLFLCSLVLLLSWSDHGAALSARSMPLRGLPRPVTKSKPAPGEQMVPHEPLAEPVEMSAIPEVTPYTSAFAMYADFVDVPLNTALPAAFRS